MTQVQDQDSLLLKRFQNEVGNRIPHFEDAPEGPTLVNPTPLVDLTLPLKECAKQEYGMDLTDKRLTVLGKLESRIPGGSVKARPAVEIVRDAIAAGKLRMGQTIFEATSGNFGIALGQLTGLGLGLVVLVSRRLQRGVIEVLREAGVKTIDLDVDICPAPGMKVDTGVLVAKTVTEKLRSDLAGLGFDGRTFDGARDEAEGLIARQDVISLAKLLARIYGGFCPEQYDNELNVRVHEAVTAPEIDSQLAGRSSSLGDFSVVCAFGTGGTSNGIGRYVQSRYGRKAVHVVFPLAGQDVAGIRTKEKAVGLRFYNPSIFAGEHEVDFAQAGKLMGFFVGSGFDIGESSALALYAVMQMANFNGGGNYVVILADGASKYKQNAVHIEEARDEVTLEEAASSLGEYGTILWTHAAFLPSAEGTKLIADSLGCREDDLKIVKATEVAQLINGCEVPEGLAGILQGNKGKVLLVCMAGGTSLRVAQVLSRKGIEAQSLRGGMSALSQASGKQVSTLVRPAMTR
jgi:cysteine synthase/rhodanese-related sulfurtransferase